MKTFLKIIAITLLIALLVGGVYVIYTYFFAASVVGVPSAAPGQPNVTAQPENADVIKPVSQEQVFDYWVNSKTNAMYFVKPDGKVVKTFGDGREEVVGTQTLQGLHRIESSPDGMRALAHFGYPGNDVFAVFDTEARSWERLPYGATMATFDPTGQKVAYLRRVNNGSTLTVLNLSDKKASDVMNLAVADGTLQWHNAQEIWLIPPPTARVFADALIVDIAKRTARAFLAGAMLSWNTTGNMGLKLSLSTSGTALSLLAGGREEILPFTTIPSKCAPQPTAIYCGVPIEFPARSVLPDDYLQKKFFTRDGLTRYDIGTRRESMLFQAGDVLVDIDHPIVRGKQLLFKNRYDEKVYAVELK